MTMPGGEDGEAVELEPRHGHCEGGERTRTYRIWQGMRQRCYNPNHLSYPDYGAKGVRIYWEWLGRGGFAAFLRDLGECPSDLHSLDRIDPEGSYDPWNCRWIEHAENCRRVRRVSHRHRKVKARGPDGRIRELTLVGWAKRLGISYDSLQRRIQRGMGERAFSTPGRR
jgi:hypothetical protein